MALLIRYMGIPAGGQKRTQPRRGWAIGTVSKGELIDPVSVSDHSGYVQETQALTPGPRILE
jgi:hypothetical protein